MGTAIQDYLFIINTLTNGNLNTWIKIAKQKSNFPNGCDEYIGRRWITNAIDCGSLKAIRWMLDQKVDLDFVDEEGYSVLHSCIDRELPNKYNIMQLLIDANAPINIGTTEKRMAVNGYSPLHLAVIRKDLKAVRLLLKNGADTNLKTCVDDYCTAEETARICGYLEIAASIRQHSFKEF